MNHTIPVHTLRALALLVATGLLGACKPNGAPTAASPTPGATDADKPAQTAVALVDGTPITRDIYDFYTKSVAGKAAGELTDEQKGQVLDELISTQLIANQAIKDGLDKDSDTASRLAVARMRLLADSESQKVLKGKEPTEQELRVEYEAAITGMDKTEYHARHILVATKDLADQLTKQIKAGAKFEAVAKANSMDGSKERGGDLGWFSLSRMVKPFGDAVKSLKKGEMTAAPVQTQFGWHIIKLEETREATPPPFEQVKEQLANRIMQKKLQAYVDELKKTAKIEKKI
ncbi:MAG: peptidylprolyl isomerase [Proteobacteria bacterium]|nr:peptidylprolyl isomerase [Pseudomonadota bacterium]